MNLVSPVFLGVRVRHAGIKNSEMSATESVLHDSKIYRAGGFTRDRPNVAQPERIVDLTKDANARRVTVHAGSHHELPILLVKVPCGHADAHVSPDVSQSPFLLFTMFPMRRWPEVERLGPVHHIGQLDLLRRLFFLLPEDATKPTAEHRTLPLVLILVHLNHLLLVVIIFVVIIFIF